MKQIKKGFWYEIVIKMFDEEYFESKILILLFWKSGGYVSKLSLLGLLIESPLC